MTDLPKPYDSGPDTRKHIGLVRERLAMVRDLLARRGEVHDQSKVVPGPEKEGFDVHRQMLDRLEYGTPEYMAHVESIKPLMEMHYRNNSHHPEHYPNGVNGMSLLDLIEMLCDWDAAAHRKPDGHLSQGFEFNLKRHNIDTQLGDVLRNTARELGWLP